MNIKHKLRLPGKKPEDTTGNLYVRRSRGASLIAWLSRGFLDSGTHRAVKQFSTENGSSPVLGGSVRLSCPVSDWAEPARASRAGGLECRRSRGRAPFWAVNGAPSPRAAASSLPSSSFLTDAHPRPSPQPFRKRRRLHRPAG